MEKKRKLILSLGVTHSLNHSFFLILPPILFVVVSEFNSSFEEIGLVATFSFLIYGLGALVGGPLADKGGSMKIIQVGSLIAGFSTFIILFSTNLFIFGIGMLVMSFGASLYHPTANRLIVQSFHDNTAHIMGIHGALGNLGQISTPAVAFWLGILFGWRIAFIFFGILSIIFGAIFSTFNILEVSHPRKKIKISEFLTKDMLYILIYSMLGGLSAQGVLFFFPTFLSVERTITPALAAYASSAVLVMGVLSQLLIGRIADAYGYKKLVIITNVGIFIGLLFLLWIPVNIIAMILFIIFYGASLFGNQPPTTCLIGKVAPQKYTGIIFGLAFSLSFGVGSISTTLTGFLADLYSLSFSFNILAIIAFTTIIASLFLPVKQKID